MRQRLRPIIAALLVCGVATQVTASAFAAGSSAPAAIQVLSNRADLISGGDALVSVQLPGGVSPSDVRMTLGSRNVTHQFAIRPNGLYEGLLTGLANGPNTLSAAIPGHDTADETIVNHPIGGPVSSGPQLKPWVCQNGSSDPECNAPTTYAYEYKSSVTGGFEAYDPSSPASDMA